jgi:hypothetical protein
VIPVYPCIRMRVYNTPPNDLAMLIHGC